MEKQITVHTDEKKRFTCERPLHVSRPLPPAHEPVSDGELEQMELLLDLIPRVPVKDCIHPVTDEPCIIVADDDAEFAPAEIVSGFDQDNAAIPPFFALCWNVMPRLIAEIRRYRS